MSLATGRHPTSRPHWARSAAVVLACIAAASGLTGCTGQTLDGTPAQPSPAATAATSSSQPASVESGSGPLTVVRPETLGGRPRIDIGNGTSSEESFRTTAEAQGVYGNVAKQDLIFLVAVASTDQTTEARFSNVIAEASKEFKVDNYRTVEPGAMGGLVRCGDGTLNGVPAAVCVWSDRGTNGVLVHSLQSADEFAGDVVALRAEVEKAA
jgi:hypothetical protein